MARHPHIINLSELGWKKINGPQGSLFGGERKRVGMKIGARKFGYGFLMTAKTAKRLSGY